MRKTFKLPLSVKVSRLASGLKIEDGAFLKQCSHCGEFGSYDSVVISNGVGHGFIFISNYPIVSIIEDDEERQ